MFDHAGTTVVIVMRNLTVEVFDHLDITSPMDVYQRLPYTQRIFRGAALKIIERLL